MKTKTLLFILAAAFLASCTPQSKIETDETDTHLADIIENLTSISYIQKYEDNVERVTYCVDTLAFVPDTLKMNFDLHSVDAAKTIASKWESVLSVRAVYTATKASAGDIVNLEVTGASANDGILSVRVWPRKLDRDFIYGKVAVSISLIISSGQKRAESDYISLLPEITDKGSSFSWYLLDNFDTDGDGIMSDGELAAIEELNISGMDLTNIDWLMNRTVNLKVLDCSDNVLSTIDLSKNITITTLNCSNNRLTELDLVNQGILESLDCSNNALTALDLSNQESLESLDCSNNALTALDLSNQESLESLDCSNNVLTDLNGLYKKSSLRTIDISHNQLMDIQVLEFAENLKYLNCSFNKFTGFSDYHFVNSDAHAILDCSNNLISSLALTEPETFTTVKAYGNPLRDIVINFDKAPALEELYLIDSGVNAITGTTFSLDGAEYTGLDVQLGSYFTSLSINGCSNLGGLYIYGDNLTEIDCSGNALCFCVLRCPALETLNCSNNQFITEFYLDCECLKTLDISENTSLKEISVSDIKSLTELNVSGNTALTKLDLPAETVKLIISKGLNSSIYKIGQYVSIDGGTGVVYKTEIPCIISTEEYLNDFAYSPNGWGLPSLDEWQIIYNEKSTLNKTLESIGATPLGARNYWSSNSDYSGHYVFNFNSKESGPGWGFAYCRFERSLK